MHQRSAHSQDKTLLCVENIPGIFDNCDPGFLDGRKSVPSETGLDLPRWTQDGRLLVTSYSDKLEEGAVYIYDTSGQGQEAAGSYILSSSHDGQKWFPWQPGKTWDVGRAEGVDSYYSD